MFARKKEKALLATLQKEVHRAVHLGHAKDLPALFSRSPADTVWLASGALLAAIQDQQIECLQILLDHCQDNPWTSQCQEPQPSAQSTPEIGEDKEKRQPRAKIKSSASSKESELVQKRLRTVLHEALFAAVAKNSGAAVQTIVESAVFGVVHPIQPLDLRTSALLHAIVLERLGAVTALLRCGVDPNAFGPKMDNALFTVVQSDMGVAEKKAMIQLLLPLCNTQTLNRHGQTLLMAAAMDAHPEVVRMLLPLSDANAQDPRGETALSLALNEQNWGCADEVLLHMPLTPVLEALAKANAPEENLPKWKARLERERIQAALLDPRLALAPATPSVPEPRDSDPLDALNSSKANASVQQHQSLSRQSTGKTPRRRL